MSRALVMSGYADPDTEIERLREREKALEDALRAVYNRANDVRRWSEAHCVIPHEFAPEMKRRADRMAAAMGRAMETAPPPRRFAVEDAEALVPLGAALEGKPREDKP